MAVKQILFYPEDTDSLTRKSEKVKKVDDNIRKLILDLKDTLSNSTGMGISAPQIGVYKQVIVVRFESDLKEENTLRAFINPQILQTGMWEKGFDGCLSIPRIRTWESIRPSRLIFTALDESGKHVKLTIRDSTNAHLIHHEVDHLNGVLFFKRLEAHARLYRLERDKEGKDQLIEMNDHEKKALLERATVLGKISKLRI